MCTACAQRACSEPTCAAGPLPSCARLLRILVGLARPIASLRTHPRPRLQVPVLFALREPQLFELARCMRNHSVAAGQVVLRQGDAGPAASHHHVVRLEAVLGAQA